eukprot:UN01349
MNSMKNCYDGHGATNMENPPDSSAGTMSLYNCQQLCDRTDGCTGVTVSNNVSSVAGYINCYRRKNINLGQCDGDMSYDTYTKINAFTMKIFVKVMGKIHTLTVDVYEEIRNVKNKIKDETGVHPREQRLMFKGEEMKYYLTLSDYGVKDESILHLLRGGE